MLLGKWMAVEAAVDNVILLLMLALGSGLTVAYWARWAGLVLAVAPKHRRVPEDSGWLRLGPTALLAGLTLVGGAATPWLYGLVGGPGPAELRVGGFVVAPLVAAALLGVAVGVRGMGSARKARSVGTYLSGLPETEPHGAGYAGPLGGTIETRAGLYAFARIFGADRLLPWINGLAVLGLCALVLVAWLGGGA
jgi:ech hydrogenase subunit A